jgi:flagellar motor switch protein FliM
MSKILSQEEIDALLGSTAKVERQNRAPEASHDTVITYNFRRPDRVSKEQIRSLHFLHDRFARNVSQSLSAYLRSVTEVSIVSVEQFTYSEFLMSLPDPTAFYALSLNPLDGQGALEINPVIAFTMIDRMLGGTGQRPPMNRALTEIEQNVVDSVIKLILENLTETWRAVFDLQFRIHARETRPQMLQVAGPNEVVILLVFDLKVGDIRGMLNLCIPASAIEATGSAFVQGWHRTHRDPTAEERRWLEDSLARMPLSVTATLETTLKARELVELNQGDVLSLGVPIQTPVTVRVESTPKFGGRLIAPDARVGVFLESMTGTTQSLEKVS